MHYSYFLQSLRQIPDVAIVKDSGVYTIRLMALETAPNFYTIAYLLTSSTESVVIGLFVSPESKDVVNQLLKGTGRFLIMGIFHASPQTLEQQCKSIIVQLDGQFFQEFRNANQQIIGEIQNH